MSTQVPCSAPATAIKLDVFSGPTAAREALERLETELCGLKLHDDDWGSIKLVLAETLNNIVEHAFAPPTQPGLINVECKVHDDCLQFNFKDNGNGMPNGELPAGHEQNLDVDLMDLPEGGFGWFLIQQLATEVIYKRTQSTNILSLKMPVTSDA